MSAAPRAAGRATQPWSEESRGPWLGETARINLFWLIHLRWAAVLGQLGTILFVERALEVPLPMVPLLAVLAVEVATNALLQLWFRRRQGRGWDATRASRVQLLQAGVMGFDLVLLSMLLYWTGGVANPFSAFYLVNVVLGAVLLEARWAWALAGLAVCALGLLVLAHHPLPVLDRSVVLRHVGLVVALAMAAMITVYFVTRVTLALSSRSEELRAERERQARSERLEALATLAAGAAHELASPLSTIAVVARDLERRLEREGATEDDLEDARLVRQELARCRRILDRMTLDAGTSAGEEMRQLSVEQLLQETLAELPASARVEVEVDPRARRLELFVPSRGLAMALRAVVKNAMDASRPEDRVRLGAFVAAAELVLAVEDRGHGMDEEQLRRALDPFFTTKEPGQGMGLGLFLARSVFDRLGGDLRLASRPGAGTRVEIRLPLGRLRPGAPDATLSP